VTTGGARCTWRCSPGVANAGAEIRSSRSFTGLVPRRK
jgi:hypothetical protein